MSGEFEIIKKSKSEEIKLDYNDLVRILIKNLLIKKASKSKCSRRIRKIYSISKSLFNFIHKMYRCNIYNTKSIKCFY